MSVGKSSYLVRTEVIDAVGTPKITKFPAMKESETLASWRPWSSL